MPGRSYVYVATPYSKFAAGLDAAHKLACEQAAKLIRLGIPCYSPIAHTHPIAMLGALDPYDHAIWIPADTPLMKGAHALAVITAEGWKESTGIGIEIAEFTSDGKPVVLLAPDASDDEIGQLLGVA